MAQVAAYEATIHLLITDVIMPGMNGRELHEALQATRPGLQVIYMSGYPADWTECIESLDATAT